MRTIPTPCPSCSGVNTIRVGAEIVPVHDGRLFHDIGACNQCGAWLVLDGRAGSVPDVITSDDLEKWREKGVVR